MACWEDMASDRSSKTKCIADLISVPCHLRGYGTRGLDVAVTNGMLMSSRIVIAGDRVKSVMLTFSVDGEGPCCIGDVGDKWSVDMIVFEENLREDNVGV